MGELGETLFAFTSLGHKWYPSGEDVQIKHHISTQNKKF